MTSAEILALIERVETEERAAAMGSECPPCRWAASNVLAVCRLLRETREALDIETLREYHNSSWSTNPPSYHDAAWSLWECRMCRGRYAERAQAALAACEETP